MVQASELLCSDRYSPESSTPPPRERWRTRRSGREIRGAGSNGRRERSREWGMKDRVVKSRRESHSTEDSERAPRQTFAFGTAVPIVGRAPDSCSPLPNANLLRNNEFAVVDAGTNVPSAWRIPT